MPDTQQTCSRCSSRSYLPATDTQEDCCLRCWLAAEPELIEVVVQELQTMGYMVMITWPS